MEIWEDVIGYEGHYQISTQGRLKSIKLGDNLLLKIATQSRGYLHYNLSKNNLKKGFLIHRLVANAFIPNPLNLPQVNHKDGNKLNCHKDNLEWSTGSYNLKHAYRTGLKKNTINHNFFKNHHLSKKVKIIGTNKIYLSIRSASIEMGISIFYIKRSCNEGIEVNGKKFTFKL